MIRNLLFVIALFCCSCSQGEQATKSTGEQAVADSPVTFIPASLCNKQANARTQKVYSILCQLYGSHIISGTVASVDWNTTEAENVNKWTEKYPALNAFDYINFHKSKDVNPGGWIDYTDISPVKNWWEQGGLVSCMWHWQVLDNSGSGYTCTPGTGSNETSINLSEINDPSSKTYQQLIKDMDQIAGYLGKLQAAGIPVIWRPLHEAAGNTYEFNGGKAWFWWGAKGAEPFKKLWRLMYDRFTNKYHLNNLIWVWTAQTGDESWYPGDDVVDIIGIDRYGILQYPAMKYYKSLSAAYPHKLITMAECGNGDNNAMADLGKMWDRGAHFSWFMTWYDYDYNNGKSAEHRYATKAWWQEAFSHDYVVTRDEMKTLLQSK